MATLDEFPTHIREAAAKAHAEYASSRVRDNLGVIIARAIATSIEKRDEEMRTALADPNVVHIGLLRGTIAKPTPGQISHVYATNAGAVWWPIETAPRECTVDRSGLPDVTGWTTETIWVRDADGRVYEAWYVGRGPYWWDADGETECAPIEWMPHPLWKPEEEEQGNG